jgi:hypothetical protein
MVAPLVIESGITFEGGVSVGPAATLGPSFTISPSDFANANNGQNIVTNTPTGFTNNGTQGPGENYYAPLLGAFYGGTSPAKLDELRAFWAANGLVSDGSASYIFTATWGPGSSPQSDKVVIALYEDPNYGVIDIGTVSTATNNWQTGGQDIYNSGGNPAGLLSAQGTYNFPATFTLYSPLITNNADWC